MFTGIVQGKSEVTAIEKRDALSSITFRFPPDALSGLQRGASIAINGCCLTVTTFDTALSVARFDVMKESLNVTNLGELAVGSITNFERAAKIGDEIGGHMMSGHISSTVKLLGRNETETNCELIFECPNKLQRYVLPKGYIGINGCSLTIGAEVTERFSVHLIPETLEVTTFGQLQEGTSVNIEIDPSTQAIIDTVERYMTERPANLAL
jgi:riboflavin synthase